MKGFWVHERFMDVFIEVLRVQYQDQKRIKLRVNWWNRGYTDNPWIMEHNKPLTILTKDRLKWRHCNEKGK